MELPARFPDDPHRVLQGMFPVGDLDGDGAADLYATSMMQLPSSEGALTLPQLHIHYGTPGALTPPVR
jgi:hypothetical protein